MYSLSKDYEKLFDLLCAGYVLVGWVDYVTHTSADGKNELQRDVVQIRRHGEYDIFVGVRGTCYGSIYPFHQEKGNESSLLVNLCESLSLAWVKPVITNEAATVAAALRELRAELVADANAMATHGSGTSACTIQDAFDATIAKLGLEAEAFADCFEREDTE